MQQTSKNNSFINLLYAFVITVYIFRVYDVTWFYFFPASMWLVVTLIVIGIKFLVVRNSGGVVVEERSYITIMFLLLYCLYSGLISYYGVGLSGLRYLTLFISISSIILLLSIEEKKFVLNFITNAFVIVLTVSLLGWFLYLGGVDLPHSYLIEHWNGFHTYYDYYLFRITPVSMDSIFPRFQSVFLEPGQMATPCVFLFYLNSNEKKTFNFQNVILLVAIFLSFSLIAYGMMVIVIVSIAWFKGKTFRLPITIIAMVSIVGFYFYMTLSSEDNAVNTLIMSRLEYDEENMISGNNRTSHLFDINYQQFIQSKDKYLGIHHELRTGYDWTNNSSGYKKFIVHEGIVGFVIFMLYILSLYRSNRSAKSLVLLIIVVSSFLVRNLLQNPMWMSIAVLGFYTLNNKDSISVIKQY